MTYLLAVIAGMAAAVIGWFVTGALAAWIAGWFGMSDFEGGRGMFAFLFVGPIGGLISMVAAVWLVLRMNKVHATAGATTGRVVLVLGAIAAIVAAGITLRLYTVDTYSDEAPPQLLFELRVPATTAVPARAQTNVELHTDRNVGSGQLFDEWSRRDAYHLVTGGVPLAFKTSSRILVVSLGEQPSRLFRLSLGRNPASTATMSAWQRADHLDMRDEEAPRKAPPDDPLEMRYRVQRAGED
jgi:hypothetical protein